MQLENIDKMNRLVRENRGMDIILVSTTSPQLEAYWQKRLEAARGQICNKDACILVVCQD